MHAAAMKLDKQKWTSWSTFDLQDLAGGSPETRLVSRKTSNAQQKYFFTFTKFSSSHVY